jgi:hypothetical protein
VGAAATELAGAAAGASAALGGGSDAALPVALAVVPALGGALLHAAKTPHATNQIPRFLIVDSGFSRRRARRIQQKRQALTPDTVSSEPQRVAARPRAS